MNRFKALFTPVNIGNLRIRNRIVMPPMATNLAGVNGEVTDQMIAYYEARARGGAGLIIIEASCVDTPVGNRGPGQINIDDPKYLPGLFRLAESVKLHGSRVFVQLFHPGRQKDMLMAGVEQAVAPSAIPCPVIKAMPRELELAEIRGLVSKFVTSASYAARAGFDGVELHAAHGYLINQFLSPCSNQREDEYGGTLTNRMRFLLEIVRGIKETVPGLLISVRLNMDDFVPDGLSLAESIAVSKQLEQEGIDLIHCSCGTYESGLTSIEPCSYEEGWRVYLAEAVKQAVNIPVITGGMISHPEYANQIIETKKADLVFLGRTLLADPEWPNKVKNDTLEEIRPCIRCNTCINQNFKGVQIRCAVNPNTGREMFKAPNKSRKRQALIVGGGPAGMQAALSLRRRGLEVCLYEQHEELGGYMSLAGVHRYKNRILDLRDYMVRQVYQAGVKVFLNQRVSIKDITTNAADLLVIATGSRAIRPAIKGSDLGFCIEGTAVLNRDIELYGQEIIVIGGGSTGCEVADYLAGRNNTVTVLEKGNHLAVDMERKNRRSLMTSLEKAEVKKLIGVTVLEITPGFVRIAHKSGPEQELPVDYVVWSTGFEPEDKLYRQAQDLSIPVYLLGDVAQVRGFQEAIMEGEMLGQAVL